eukprot:UN04632
MNRARSDTPVETENLNNVGAGTENLNNTNEKLNGFDRNTSAESESSNVLSTGLEDLNICQSLDELVLAEDLSDSENSDNMQLLASLPSITDDLLTSSDDAESNIDIDNKRFILGPNDLRLLLRPDDSSLKSIKQNMDY